MNALGAKGRVEKLRRPRRDGELVVLGVSHHSAPVELRERITVAPEHVGAAALRMRETLRAREVVVLSTCNRLEVIAITELADPLEAFANELSRSHDLPRLGLDHHLYLHRGRAALRHLFRVASSLDSMVLGEPQILGQIKKQFRQAAAAAAAAGGLKRCFDRAFRVGKRVRTETAIGQLGVSVASTAVELATRIFDDLAEKTVMLVGAGEMAELAARHFRRAGAHGLIVVNRSFERAVELSRVFGGTPVPLERIEPYLHMADIVVGSVGGAGWILGPAHFTEALRLRRRRPMFLIDLGVPRNFDPAVNELEGVYLYDMDDLDRVAQEHREQRSGEARKAEVIVEEEVERYFRQLSDGEVTPTIVALRDKAERIRQAEVERALHSLPDADEASRAVLDAMSNAIVNKLLHGPLVALKELAREEAAVVEEAAEMVRRLFALEGETPLLPTALVEGEDDEGG